MVLASRWRSEWATECIGGWTDRQGAKGIREEAWPEKRAPQPSPPNLFTTLLALFESGKHIQCVEGRKVSFLQK